MTATAAALWRHPIKAHGREALSQATLIPDQTLPWDRVWAVAHEAAQLDGGEWVKCANFTRGAKVPALMAITAAMDEVAETVTLDHPDLAPITFAPDTDAQAFLDWVMPLMPEGRAQPTGLVRAARVGFTDSPFPSISLTNLATLRELSECVGQDLSPDRFRSNVWIDGLAPWTEFDWVGQEIAFGGARLKIEVRIGRCLATAANPDTGIRDADTLGALKEGWGRTQFGIYGRVVQGGPIAVGDRIAPA